MDACESELPMQQFVIIIDLTSGILPPQIHTHSQMYGELAENSTISTLKDSSPRSTQMLELIN